MAKNWEQAGKILTIVESVLTQPTRTGELVESGDPVFVGSIVGVAQITALASTDNVTVDTEGVYRLAVVAKDGAGVNSAVALGDQLFIDSAAIINKGQDGLPFGYALGTVTAGSTTTIAVKLVGQKKKETFLVNMSSFKAADVANGIWIAPFPCKLVEAIESHGVVSSGAAQVSLEKCNTGEAAGAGTEVLASGFDMTSTVNTPVTDAAVTSGEENFIDGDQLRVVLASGTATGIVDAVITAVFERL